MVLTKTGEILSYSITNIKTERKEIIQPIYEDITVDKVPSDIQDFFQDERYIDVSRKDGYAKFSNGTWNRQINFVEEE
jgi:DNA topoisomerase VI subunit A